MKIRVVKLSLLSILLLSACTVNKNNIQLPAENPFSITIANEAIDKDAIHTVLSIESNSSWSPKDVAINFVGLKDGEIIYQHLSAVSQLINREDLVRPSNEPVLVPITIPGKELTDYQITVLWGQEAKLKLRPRAKPVLTDISMIEGDTFKIKAQLVNEGGEILNNCTLGVSFIWKSGVETVDLQSPVYENEEEIVLEDLGLKSGDKTEINLDIPYPKNLKEGGKLIPQLRVIK